MPLGRLVSGSSSQLSTPTLDKMTRAIRAKGSLPARAHAMQGVVVKGKRNLIRPSPHGQPQSAPTSRASSPRPLRCAVFGARGAALNRLILKGPKVAVDRRLRPESWQASDGTNRSRLRVVADDVELMSPPTTP